MIKISAVKSLDDIPENIRGLFSLEDGVLSLDESKIRTESDVSRVKEAKDKEVRDHNATKAELAKYRNIGKTPEELSDHLADLESRAGSKADKDDRLVTVTRENNQLKTELAAVKNELDSIKPDYETIKQDLRQRRTSDALKKFVGTLKGVDVDRLSRALDKDIQLGFIELDESGEGLILAKGGGKLEDYAMTTARDFGFLIGNIPGGSNPGERSVPPSVERNFSGVPQEMSFVDESVLADLNK